MNCCSIGQLIIVPSAIRPKPENNITWKELRVESQSAYEFPSGKDTRMKLDKAVFIRSGRRQRTTSIFWNGTRSRPALRYWKEERHK